MNTMPYWNTTPFNGYDPFNQMNGQGAQFNAFAPLNQQFNTQFNGYNPGASGDVWGPLRDLSFQSQGVNGANGAFPSVPSNLPAVPTTLPYMDPAQTEVYLRTGQVPTGTGTTPATPTAPTAEMTAARTLILANSGGALVDANLAQSATVADINVDGTPDMAFQYGASEVVIKFIPGATKGTNADFENTFAQAMAAATKSATFTKDGKTDTLAILGTATDAAGKTFYVVKITSGAPAATPPVA